MTEKIEKSKHWWKIREIKFWGLVSCILFAATVNTIILLFSLVIFHRDKGEVIAAILTLCSGLMLAIPGVYITFKRQQVLEDQKNIEHKENKLHEISDRHERFRLASEQLGKNAAQNTPDIPARLGAVISLANLADEWEESDNVPQRDVCINMLISYLKIEPTIKNIPFAEFIKNNTDEELKIDDVTIRDEILNQITYRLPYASIDHNKINGSKWVNYNYNFSNSYIANIDFSKKNLSEMNFNDVNFIQIANFNETEIKNIYFSSSKFYQPLLFNGATIKGQIEFNDAKLNLHGINSYTFFNYTNFSNEPNFFNAEFNCVSFIYTIISESEIMEENKIRELMKTSRKPPKTFVFYDKNSQLRIINW